MDEKTYFDLIDHTLAAFCDAVELADAEGELDAECQQGILTISLPDKRQLVLSRHAPSRQFWLSSPISGGLHFSWNGSTWMLPDGRELKEILKAELESLAHIKVSF